MKIRFCINKEDLSIYIAAPFFNDEQRGKVEMIEQTLDYYAVGYYSPRSEGVIQTMTKEEKEERANYIYERNILEMNNSNMMLAIIDDFDVGTVFEMGYFHSMGLPVVSISGEGYGMNIMLRNSVSCHCPRLEDFKDLMARINFEGEADSEYFSLVSKFEGDVF